MEPANNPYAPPKTLALEVPAEAAPEGSRHVKWACWLMWIGFGASILDSAWSIFINLPLPSLTKEIAAELIGLAIAFAIVFWFTNKLSAGRNWMRWLITVLNLVATVVIVIFLLWILARWRTRSFFADVFRVNPVYFLDMVLQMALGLAEVVLINTPSARAWFQALRRVS